MKRGYPVCYDPLTAERLAVDALIEKFGKVNGYQCIQCGSTLYGRARRWCNGRSGAECRRFYHQAT